MNKCVFTVGPVDKEPALLDLHYSLRHQIWVRDNHWEWPTDRDVYDYNAAHFLAYREFENGTEALGAARLIHPPSPFGETMPEISRFCIREKCRRSCGATTRDITLQLIEQLFATCCFHGYEQVTVVIQRFFARYLRMLGINIMSAQDSEPYKGVFYKYLIAI